jgi:hypothetical protein
MRAFINDVQIPLEAIELDDMGWDRQGTRRDEELLLEIAPEDLDIIGRYLYSLACEYCSEEPGYFEDEYMRDVPRPPSPGFLAEDPHALLRYFKESFWHREAILAVMQAIDGHRADKAPRYWIQDYRGIVMDDGRLFLRLGVQAGT